MGNGISHLHFLGILDAGYDIAHLARTEFLAGYHVHLEYTHLVSVVLHSGIEEFHLVARSDDTVDNLEVGNDASEGVEHRVENQSLKRCLFIACGMRDTLYHRIQDVLNAFARLT